MIVLPNAFLVFCYFQLNHIPQYLVYLVFFCEPFFQVVGQSPLESTYTAWIAQVLSQAITEVNCMFHEKQPFSFFESNFFYHLLQRAWRAVNNESPASTGCVEHCAVLKIFLLWSKTIFFLSWRFEPIKSCLVRYHFRTTILVVFEPWWYIVFLRWNY